MSLRLHCVRHAPTDCAGFAVGRTDVPTVMAAGDAADRIDATLPVDISAVWSSPSRRCREPAALIAARRGVPHHVDPDLHELDQGIFEGRAYRDLEREEPQALSAWMESWIDRGPPGGEGARDLERRVGRWLAARRTEAPSDVAVVAHAGVIRALRVLIERQTWEAVMGAPVPHLERVELLAPDLRTTAPRDH